MKKDYLFIPAIIVFSAYFIYRLVDQSQMLWQFPLDFTNDWASYIAQLHFLKVCGFHAYCPYWFNGLTTFTLTPPGWFYFTLPLYALFGNILYATYSSMVIIFIISFVASIVLGQLNSLSKIKSILLFSVLFMNANIIGTYVRQGRITELFGLMLFYNFALLVFYYKDKLFTGKFILIPILLLLLILSNIPFAAIALILLAGLFLASNKQQKFIIILSVIFPVAATAFWWLPFLHGLPASLAAHLENNFAGYLLHFNKDTLFINLAATIPAAIFLATVLILAVRQYLKKNDILFYLPILIIALLIISRAIVFIPILKSIYPDVYFSLFVFLTTYLFLQVRSRHKIILLALLFVTCALLSIALSHYHTPYFASNTELQKDILSALPEINDKFLILTTNPEIYSKALYAYAAIYHAKSTPSGWHASINYELYQRLSLLGKTFMTADCTELKNKLHELSANEILSTGDTCNKLASCNFEKTYQKQQICIYGA